jgi:phage tail-like protein
MTPYYPPPAFRFSVKFLSPAAIVAALTGHDASFQEVSGIQASWDVEEVAEGGENRFVHRLPKRGKYSNLVLKRGVVTETSFLSEWVGSSIGASLSLPIIPQNLMVMLLDPSDFPVIVWGFVNAYPVKCDLGPMDSMENKILVETLELSYNYYERVTLGSPLSIAVKLAQLAARLA